jgi:hypothetical protein
MRNLGILLGTVITGALLTLSTTTASAQVCASLNLTTQAEVDAVSCSSVTGNVTISGSDITNVDGLGGITLVGGYLEILSNIVLTNVDGLGGITSVGGYLVIETNGVLTNVDGLGGITSVGGNLEINNNNDLTNVNGLGGITSVGGDLRIEGNDALDIFCGLYPLLDASGLVGTYTVATNATNPTEAEILAGGACLVLSVPALSPLGMAMLLSVLGLVGHWRLRRLTGLRRRLN